MNESNVIKKANELGEAILLSPQYARLQAASAVYEADEEAMRLTEEYNLRRGELSAMAQKEDITPLDMLRLRESLSSEFTKLSENVVMKEYLEAKKDMEALLGEIDGIIRYYVTGEEPEGCGGSCGSCGGGCH